MKILLILCAFFLLTNPANAQTEFLKETLNNREEREAIKTSGIKSKTVRIVDYDRSSGSFMNDSGYKAFFYGYDNEGKLTDYVKYQLISSLTERETYTYNPKGNIDKVRRFNKSDDVIEEITYKYNSHGNIKREEHVAFYNNPPLSMYFTITAHANDANVFWDLQNDLDIDPKLDAYSITVNITDPDPQNQYVVIGDERESNVMRFPWSQLSLMNQKELAAWTENRVNHFIQKPNIDKVVYKYNALGDRIQKLVYTTAGDLILKEDYGYDLKGTLNLRIRYDESGKEQIHETYTYNANGNILSYDPLGADGRSLGKSVYVYDDKNRLTEKSWFKPDGNPDSKFIYKYDEHGWLTERILKRADEEIAGRTVYKYDEKGNLIETRQFTGESHPEKLTRYVYEFYK